MSKPSPSSVLAKEVALQVAELARVPRENRDRFCDLLYGTVQKVWDCAGTDSSMEPGLALADAANGARTLHKQIGLMKEADRVRIEKLVVQTIPDKGTRQWLEGIHGHRIDLPWYAGGL